MGIPEYDTNNDVVEDTPVDMGIPLLDNGDVTNSSVPVYPGMEPERSLKEADEDEVQMDEILVGNTDHGTGAVVPKDCWPVDLSEDGARPVPDSELPSIPQQKSEDEPVLRVPLTPPKKTGIQGLSPTKKHMLGLVFIVLNVLMGAAAAQLAKATYSKDFSAPFFLVYFRTVWRTSIFPAFMVLKWINRRVRASNNKPMSFTKTFTDSVGVLGPQGLTLRSFFYPCGFLSGLWLLIQFMHLLAVKYLNISIVQVLFCTESAFCYALSVIVLKVPVLALKVLAVTVALGGAGLMAYSQSQGSDLRWEGIIISIAGAILGSVYLVALKKMLGKSEDVGQALLLSTGMAVFVTLFLWPVILVLYHTGVEYWNPETFPWGIICASSALSVLSVSVFNLSLTLTSPLLMTLSKLLGIPLNYFVDWLMWDHQFDGYQIAGVILIGYGFVFIALPERWITLRNWAKCLRMQSNTPPAQVRQPLSTVRSG